MNHENAIYLKAFGESVEIQTASPFLVQAIVEPDSKVEYLAETKINNQTLFLYIDENDVATKGIERRQEVIVRNQTYRIVEIGNDMNGMAIFRVSKS
jgi:pSer/pThr/pTyr-binding forkhead associated (FHA) protein